jgi:transcriptional regulator with XRE-family HTH domain
MSDVGPLLQHWRRTRRLSQLALAAEAEVSARHLCFIETGRASPSRAMVLKLAAVLDVPLRERNALLLAAGFAPGYAESPLDAPALAAVRGALDAILAQHEPYPAVVMDRNWDIERTNEAARRFFGFLLDKHPPAGPGPANVLRLMLHPGGVRPYVTNWPGVAAALVARVRREALGGATDERARRLLAEALAYPGVPDAIAPADAAAPLLPVVPVRFAKDGRRFDYFSTVTTLGTPQDVTLQELRIESFFPADDQTRDAARRLLCLPGEDGRAPASG